MRVLIANAVHNSKDYAMDRWIKNVSELQSKNHSDFLIVDNSPDSDYVKKLKSYCEKHHVKNYKIIHIDLPLSQEKFERIARSREVIRKIVLAWDYEAWFSWESDILIPRNSLDKLITIMSSRDYSVVAHNNWDRNLPNEVNYDWGLALIKRRALEKYEFLFELGINGAPKTYEPSEEWFRKRMLRDGENFIEVDGIFDVIHLDNP